MADSSLSMETLKSLSEAQSKITDARKQAVDAMQERSALLAKIDKLEEKVADAENWEVDKQRYERQAAASGAFFYSLKADNPSNEPAHSLCARCYENGRKSVLKQLTSSPTPPTSGYSNTHQCSECLFEVVI